MTKILTIGTGAIGAFYGAKLAQSGAQLHCLCRSDFKEVSQNGFEIKSTLGDFNFKPKKIYQNIEQINEKFDFILVATKVLPEINLSAILKPVIHPDSAIILLQNGIFIEEDIAKTFKNNQIISALAFICVSKSAPGKINHQDYGHLTIGDFANGNSQKIKILGNLFEKSAIKCHISENINFDRWKKLVWNAAFNPISVAFGGIDTRQILNNLQSENLVQNIMKEVVILAAADGHNLPENIISENIKATKDMKPYKTSMLLDFEAGRKMEIAAILGNAIRFAKRKNIEIPNLTKIYEKFLQNYPSNF